MSTFTSMTAKVAKLLRQAEDVVGTPEEAVFQAKAFELIAKYGLDLSQIETAKSGFDVRHQPDAARWVVKLEGKYLAQQAQLLSSIVVALHGKAVIRGKDEMFIYAVERHLERIKALWSILGPQMLRLVETVRPVERFPVLYEYEVVLSADGGWEHRQVKMSTAGRLRSYRRSWIAGFASTIRERLTEQETQAIQASSGGVVALYVDDKQRAIAALHQAHPMLGLTRQYTYNPNGYAHGQRDGRSATMAHALRL